MSVPQDKPLKAIIWIAVSTKAQAEEEKISLPQQEADARALCARENYQIIDILRVPGHSRHYIDIHECNRDMLAQGINAFDRLMRHWEAQDFDVLVVRDSERFARTQTLHAHVVESTIMSGGHIYSLTDGPIDDTNYDMFIALGGYKSAGDVKRLVKRRKEAMRERAKKGLPTSSGVPMSHKLIRDERGKPVRLVVDESKRRLWDDLVTVLLEGIGWRDIEKELYKRFGHANERGEPWHTNRMYALLTNPTFWGHSAQHYRLEKRFANIGDWIFEPGHEIPPGVTIHYNTHEAVYEEEQREKVKAEFRRRQGMVGGMRPRNTHRFSGLVVCGECGYYLITSNTGTGGKTWGLRCMSHYNQSATRPDCPQNRWIREEYIQEYLHMHIREIVETGNWSALFEETPAVPNNGRALQQIETEIASLENEIGIMIVQQARQTTQTLHDLFQTQIDRAGERLEILKARQTELCLTESQQQYERQHSQRALEQILQIGLPNFWGLPSHEQQGLLLQLMGNRRLVAKDGVIVGTAEAPKYRRRPQHRQRRKVE
ncbi:MAG: recombinase family protein [Anaerolineae bacterium]|nr:recombinase family protein [Anaerolineae bacterium]